jgi:hypothetical protein
LRQPEILGRGSEAPPPAPGREVKSVRCPLNEVLGHLRIPQRIGLVLQGEGLLNDATALFIYRAAVAAAAGSFSLVGDAPVLVLAAVASLAAGYVVARLYLVVSAFVRDPVSSTVPTICQNLWRVASGREVDAFTDHHGCNLCNDFGSSDSRGELKNMQQASPMRSPSHPPKAATAQAIRRPPLRLRVVRPQAHGSQSSELKPSHRRTASQ